jgi:uncharacterized protein YeaO (DUF488 family)
MFHFRTLQLDSPRQPDEGLRIGTVRYLPRGVPKAIYTARAFFDVWLPILAPSQELLAQRRAGTLSTAAFLRRYRREMAAIDVRQVISLVATMARTTPLSVGCYCEDESICHRSVLGELIWAAG